MPIGVPRIIYCWGEELPAQWTDIYNFIFRRRMVFLMQYLDDELCNQICGLLINIHMEDRSKEMEKKEIERSGLGWGPRTNSEGPRGGPLKTPIYPPSLGQKKDKNTLGGPTPKGNQKQEKKVKLAEDLLMSDEDLGIEENETIEQYTLQKITMEWLNWNAQFFDYSEEPYLFYLSTDKTVKNKGTKNDGLLLYTHGFLVEPNTQDPKAKSWGPPVGDKIQRAAKQARGCFLGSPPPPGDPPILRGIRQEYRGFSEGSLIQELHGDLKRPPKVLRGMRGQLEIYSPFRLLANFISADYSLKDLDPFKLFGMSSGGKIQPFTAAGFGGGKNPPQRGGSPLQVLRWPCRAFFLCSKKTKQKSFSLGVVANLAEKDFSGFFGYGYKSIPWGLVPSGNDRGQPRRAFFPPVGGGTNLPMSKNGGSQPPGQDGDLGAGSKGLHGEGWGAPQREGAPTKNYKEKLYKKVLGQRHLRHIYLEAPPTFKPPLRGGFKRLLKTSNLRQTLPLEDPQQILGAPLRANNSQIKELGQEPPLGGLTQGLRRGQNGEKEHFGGGGGPGQSPAEREGAFNYLYSAGHNGYDQTYNEFKDYYRKQTEHILQEEESKKVFVIINSFGGSVGNGITVHDALQFIKAGSLTLALGVAASAASLVLAGGTIGERYVTEGCHTMCHQPESSLSGQASDIWIDSQEIMKIRLDVAEIYSLSTYRPRHKILKDLDRDFYLTAPETLSYGLADEIATNEVMHEIIAMTNNVWDYHNDTQQRLLEKRVSDGAIPGTETAF